MFILCNAIIVLLPIGNFYNYKEYPKANIKYT